jgi:hypothetical protein
MEFRPKMMMTMMMMMMMMMMTGHEYKRVLARR